MGYQDVKAGLLDTLRYNMTQEKGKDKITPFIRGPYGVGKSQLVYEVGQELGYSVLDLRLSTVSPTDMRGYPRLNTGSPKAEMALPFYFPMPEDGPLLIFLDELNTGAPAVQVPAMEITRDYAIGGVPFPQSTLVVAAGNRAEDNGATYDIPEPLLNRFQHFELLASVTDFQQYGMTKGLDDEILGFLGFRPDYIHVAPKNGEYAFPTPRTWEYLSKLVKFNPENYSRASSLVGPGVAKEFEAFRRLRAKLPDMNDVLDNGTLYTGTERSVLFSFITGLLSSLRENFTADRFRNYLKALDSLSNKEFVTLSLFMGKNILMKETKALGIQKEYKDYVNSKQF
jgi:hypothetical protein